MSAMQGLDPLRMPLTGVRLIEASAGTGKTFTIAALYVRAVLGHGVTPLMPPQILVVTFTEAATQELRERIRARLVEAARAFRGQAAGDDFLRSLLADMPVEQHAAGARRLELAAEWMDEAAVFTIHGWSQRMLVQHAFGSGHPFEQTLEPQDGELFAECVRDYWRSTFYPLGAAALAGVLAQWRSPDDLMRSLRPLLGRGEAMLRVNGVLLAAPDDLSGLLGDYDRWNAENEVLAAEARRKLACRRRYARGHAVVRHRRQAAERQFVSTADRGSRSGGDARVVRRRSGRAQPGALHPGQADRLDQQGQGHADACRVRGDRHAGRPRRQRAVAASCDPGARTGLGRPVLRATKAPPRADGLRRSPAAPGQGAGRTGGGDLGRDCRHAVPAGDDRRVPGHRCLAVPHFPCDLRACGDAGRPVVDRRSQAGDLCLPWRRYPHLSRRARRGGSAVLQPGYELPLQPRPGRGGQCLVRPWRIPRARGLRLRRPGPAVRAGALARARGCLQRRRRGAGGIATGLAGRPGRTGRRTPLSRAHGRGLRGRDRASARCRSGRPVWLRRSRCAAATRYRHPRAQPQRGGGNPHRAARAKSAQRVPLRSRLDLRQRRGGRRAVLVARLRRADPRSPPARRVGDDDTGLAAGRASSD